MQSTQTPTLIPLAWAASGTKNAIPTASQVGITDGAASLTTGFPPLTATPLAAGGVPPSQGDFNGILNLITQLQVWMSAGGRVQYDATYAASIGGYPLGAEVRTSNGKIWRSLVENNTATPANGANWSDSDVLLAGSVLFSSLKAPNGYQKFPGGLILQWATASIAAGGTITLPIAFPSAAITAVSNTANGASWVISQTLNACVVGSQATGTQSTVVWALGY